MPILVSPVVGHDDYFSVSGTELYIGSVTIHAPNTNTYGDSTVYGSHTYSLIFEDDLVRFNLNSTPKWSRHRDQSVLTANLLTKDFDRYKYVYVRLSASVRLLSVMSIEEVTFV